MLQESVSRRRLLRGTAIAGAGLAGAALVGCGGDDDSGSSPTPGAGTGTPPAGGTTTPGTGESPSAGGPRQGGELSLALTSLPADNFDIMTNWGEAIGLSGVHVYDRLISPRPDDRVYIMEAADSVEIVDETTVVFKLKEGLVYQDIEPVNGRAVTASDIVATQEYVRDADGVLWGTFHQDVLESAEAPDDQTVIFHLTGPNSYLFSMVQLGNPGEQSIVPAELLDNLPQNEPVGSGPYQMTGYQFGVSYEYERNPTYRGSGENLPYIDKRRVLPMTDGAALEAAFRSEQIHVWIPETDAADRILNDIGDQLDVHEMLAMNSFAANPSSKRETWNDARVREAIYRAFDQEQYIGLIADGWGEPIVGNVPAALTQFQLDADEAAQWKYHDPEAGRQLLEAAGFDFSKTYEIISQSTPWNDVAVQVMQQQLNQIGIQTSITMLAIPDWLETMGPTGNYDFFVGRHPAYDTPQIPLRLHHADTRQVNKATNIADPEVDALIEASESILDPDEHIEAVKQIQRELLSRYAHLIQIYAPVNRVLSWNYVRDWEHNPSSSHPMYQTQAWLDR